MNDRLYTAARIALRVLQVVAVLAALALGFYVWRLRIDFCMSASDLSWWECALVMGGKR